MLDANARTRIREYINAELGPRERTLDIALRDAQSSFVARGVLNSSMAIQGYARVGRDELTVRAKVIWAAIRRSHASMVGDASDTTLDDLHQQIAEFMDEQTKRVAQTTSARAATMHDREKWLAFIEKEITDRAQELVANLDIEAQFYVDELKKAGDESTPEMRFYGPVGAVQTGPLATAYISQSSAESQRLLETLDALRKEVEKNGEMETEQRDQAVELVNDTVAAVTAEKPNTYKVTGLLGGLGQTIRTVASLRGAWEVVRDAAAAIGIPL